MTPIHLHRPHALGLERACRLARRWAESAERKHQMTCTVFEDEAGSRVEFERPGLHGELVARADDFSLTVTLGLLMSAFSSQIRDEIEKNLDAAIAQAGASARLEAGDGDPG